MLNTEKFWGLEVAIVRSEEVIDSWSVLIGGGQGRAEEIFGNTDNSITQTKAPNAKKERKKLPPGISRGLFGTERDFFVVAKAKNSGLKPSTTYKRIETSSMLNRGCRRLRCRQVLFDFS
jgi:hypothetical protein